MNVISFLCNDLESYFIMVNLGMRLASKGSVSPIMNTKWPTFILQIKVQCPSGITETSKVINLPFESFITYDCLYLITNNKILWSKKKFTIVTLKNSIS